MTPDKPVPTREKRLTSPFNRTLHVGGPVQNPGGTGVPRLTRAKSVPPKK